MVTRARAPSCRSSHARNSVLNQTVQSEQTTSHMNRLPKGPRHPLVVGFRYLRAPYDTVQQTAARYGDPFYWPSFMGNMVVTGDPQGIKTIYAAEPEAFVAIGAELLGPVLGESNLIILSGERHRAMRKIQTPPFHGSRMRAYGQLITDTALAVASRWPKDRPFGIHPAMQEISLQVILQAVLGLSEPKVRQDFQLAVLATIAALSPSFLFVPFLRFSLLGLSPWDRFQQTKQLVKDLFDAELARRRENKLSGEDILSLLLAAQYEDGTRLTDQDLLEQMMNLVAAGHETTASSLAWAFYFLHRDSQIKTRLEEELATLGPTLDPESVMKLPYLDAVCNETLRICPVAPMTGRVLTRPMTLLDYELPAGTHLGIASILTHRRKDIYHQPDRFIPERFLSHSYSPFEFLPFGGGTRRCLGAAFAVYEMKLVLATILRAHKLRLCSDEVVRPSVRNTTVGPGSEIPMMLCGQA